MGKDVVAASIGKVCSPKGDICHWTTREKSNGTTAHGVCIAFV